MRHRRVSRLRQLKRIFPLHRAKRDRVLPDLFESLCDRT
jgi:hypothetical protein